jgi:hypothetical protein
MLGADFYESCSSATLELQSLFKRLIITKGFTDFAETNATSAGFS